MMHALSRLSRAADSLSKKTEDLFILDFFNVIEEIKRSFDPFYTSTSLSGATDINVLHELKANMDDVGVYEWAEVEEFLEKYFKALNGEELSAIIDIAADRFNNSLELEEPLKADFKIKAKQFVKIYGHDSFKSAMQDTLKNDAEFVATIVKSSNTTNSFPLIAAS